MMGAMALPVRSPVMMAGRASCWFAAARNLRYAAFEPCRSAVWMRRTNPGAPGASERRDQKGIAAHRLVSSGGRPRGHRWPRGQDRVSSALLGRRDLLERRHDVDPLAARTDVSHGGEDYDARHDDH